ncbi:hypothetical protein BS78_06G046000 [Paspalum vaginatum]|nr:hypothetical protein BS78_06G046000 [Paspalum vaginatum]
MLPSSPLPCPLDGGRVWPWRVRAAAHRRRRPSYGTGTGSSATAAASLTSAASSSHPWRTARSRSSGWPRRGSSRRARPASCSGRYRELGEMGVSVDSLKIRYSPFSRTTETARAVAGVLGIPFEGPSCQAVVGLRERYFGPSYELLSHDKYADVWAVDEAHPYTCPVGGESVADVASRLSSVLSVTETEFHSSAVLFVSHGDPLQIFQAVLSGGSSTFLDDVTNLKAEDAMVASILSQHRKFALVTGELRQVV